MLKVGTIKEIWRYPVKGMAGEQLSAGTISARGIQGDRTWALRDTRRKEIQSCKFRPQLLLCTARANGDGRNVDVTFPDGSTLRSDDARIHTKLSELTGHESTIEWADHAEPWDDRAAARAAIARRFGAPKAGQTE